MDSPKGTHTSEFFPPNSNMLSDDCDNNGFDPSFTGKTAAEKAKTAVELQLQNGIMVSRLWLDVHRAKDKERSDEPYQQYLEQVGKITGEMLVAQLNMHPLKAIDLPFLGLTPHHNEDKAPKFNPNATIFTPMTTPEKTMSAATKAQIFEERCQKLGLRVSPAPPKSNLDASATSFTPTSFEARCKKHGLRISSPQN
ncbi:hypothetical protein GGR53DRAFT_466090 [Hypoxylon sp. FL1150]|nr:hypothetical protein GGR53DRAFT_466090 [Hypoxylon sp. FL1150]